MQPRKVLVVDDSKLMHKMYEVMLRQYPLVYASDGRQALDRLQEHADIDLVLLDINMPNMNGLEFLAAAARRRGAQPSLPVIIISTEGREEDTARGLEAGAAAYIKKPFHSEEILEVIGRLEQGLPLERTKHARKPPRGSSSSRIPGRDAGGRAALRRWSAPTSSPASWRPTSARPASIRTPPAPARSGSRSWSAACRPPSPTSRSWPPASSTPSTRAAG